MQPKFAHRKRYRVWLERAISDSDLARMAVGVDILGQRTLPCQITRLAENAYQIELIQGLNRQIRRMAKAVGHRVIRLQRTHILDFSLDGLAQGQWRVLSSTEVESLSLLST